MIMQVCFFLIIYDTNDYTCENLHYQRKILAHQSKHKDIANIRTHNVEPQESLQNVPILINKTKTRNTVGNIFKLLFSEYW
jgi:hypothetical protein